VAHPEVTAAGIIQDVVVLVKRRVAIQATHLITPEMLVGLVMPEVLVLLEIRVTTEVVLVV
jgi:hypothetical protein